MKPYYEDELVTLYLADCREVSEWTAADVLVTDPPYGRGWKQGTIKGSTATGQGYHAGHDGIAGDEDTSMRDAALTAWGDRVAVVFGDLMLVPPAGTRQVLVFRKPPNAGMRGATGGWRRDAEAIYLLGPWSSGLGGKSSVISTGAALVGGRAGRHGGGGTSSRYGHPHAKPVDVMEILIAACPPGVIADPFAGAGSTLVAARNLGRPVIGVEIEERFCERTAQRLAQDVLISGDLSELGEL